MTWLETLLGFLRQFIPWVVVRDGYAGVRFRFGHSKGPYQPGWYFSVPMLYQMEPVFVAHRVLNLLTQSVTTKDGAPVACSANITYEVQDARLYLVAVHEPEGALAQEAMKTLHRCIRRVTLESLMGRQKGLETRTKVALQVFATRWGMAVLDVGLTDLVRSTQHRLFGDTPVVRT